MFLFSKVLKQKHGSVIPNPKFIHFDHVSIDFSEDFSGDLYPIKIYWENTVIHIFMNNCLFIVNSCNTSKTCINALKSASQMAIHQEEEKTTLFENQKPELLRNARLYNFMKSKTANGQKSDVP